VFCASLADVFDNKADPEWRADLFALIDDTPELDWLLLTKRIGNANGMMTAARLARGRHSYTVRPNIWLGITAGTQAAYDRDVPKLLATPAAVRFVSAEPLLGPLRLDLSRREGSEGYVYYDNPLTGFRSNGHGGDFGARLDWVIAGGESGPGARPMHPDWARAIRAQCAEHRTAFLFKQWGEWAPYENARDSHLADSPRAVAGNYGSRFRHLRPDGVDERDGTNATATVVRIGKKSAGRLLDGRQHDEFPRAAA
jgi:protein gp37